MEDFIREGRSAARLRVACAKRIAVLQDFRARNIPIHRRGSLWRIGADAPAEDGATEFALSHVIRIAPSPPTPPLTPSLWGVG